MVQEKYEPLAAESNAQDARKEPCYEDKTQKVEGDAGMANVNAKPPGSVCQVAAECDGSKQEEVTKDVSYTAVTKKKKEKSKKRKRISADSNDKAETRKDRCPSSDRVHSNEQGAEALSQTATKPREQIPMSRHVIRSRHIQQKKRALMDDKSLNEVSTRFLYK